MFEMVIPSSSIVFAGPFSLLADDSLQFADLLDGLSRPRFPTWLPVLLLFLLLQ
jgi:hypothetical protein